MLTRPNISQVLNNSKIDAMDNFHFWLNSNIKDLVQKRNSPGLKFKKMLLYYTCMQYKRKIA